jgi:hypothetical protein
MAKKSKSKAKRSPRLLPLLQPDAAGIDIGAEEIFVAVAAQRAPEPVRSFGSFTGDLHDLADWLQECGVKAVAVAKCHHRPLLETNLAAEPERSFKPPVAHQ